MDDRETQRVAVNLALEAGLGGVGVRVQVYDLSMDGCSIEASEQDLPAIGSLVTLKFPGGLDVTGTLAWAKIRNGGVQFNERLPTSLVQDLGFAHSQTKQKGFRDQFGRSHGLAGQRFDVAR